MEATLVASIFHSINFSLAKTTLSCYISAKPKVSGGPLWSSMQLHSFTLATITFACKVIAICAARIQGVN